MSVERPNAGMLVEIEEQMDNGGEYVFVEEFLDHKDDKLHRGVVVIEQDNLVHLRGLDFLGAALQHHRVTALAIFRPGRLGGRCCSRGRGFRRFRCHEIILASARADRPGMVIEQQVRHVKQL